MKKQLVLFASEHEADLSAVGLLLVASDMLRYTPSMMSEVAFFIQYIKKRQMAAG